MWKAPWSTSVSTNAVSLEQDNLSEQPKDDVAEAVVGQFGIVHFRGLQSSSRRPTVLQSFAPTLIKHS